MLEFLTAVTALARPRRRAQRPGPRDAIDELIDAQLACEHTPTPAADRCPHPR
ncbi:hypothetical protein [Nocardia sp. XZ_19_369]|uniref:hypothetical protein n=1 Tax=Nocardia sp. XZ_19_369 TaxID=2769487 RepID=UPI00188EE4A8|nr:hypothetical protein [Nocardia sp. XZ_19_369]